MEYYHYFIISIIISSREVAQARLLWEQRARLAVRLGHQGLAHEDLLKADAYLV